MKLCVDGQVIKSEVMTLWRDKHVHIIIIINIIIMLKTHVGMATGPARRIYFFILGINNPDGFKKLS